MQIPIAKIQVGFPFLYPPDHVSQAQKDQKRFSYNREDTGFIQQREKTNGAGATNMRDVQLIAITKYTVGKIHHLFTFGRDG